ncbi:hypothetical protein R5R35_003277 [Gryllus longicercus]|uniref:Nose resistant-to-fluoxetine protein N-terminal domain-containing protein n=1 Tax=Gryllus longicercus TaxID=2509291 RepID=A0AAN9VK23_9ORTH
MAMAVAVLAVAALALAGAASAAGAGPGAEAARVAAALMDPQAPLPWRAAGLASLSRLPAWGEMGLSENCTRDLLQMAYSFGNGSAWAIKMFDASTKIPDGLLGGHLVHLGNFDECLSVRRGEGDGSPGFDGQHCLVAFSAKLSGGEEELGAQEDLDEWQTLLHAVQSSLVLHGRTQRVEEARDIPESGALVSMLSYIPIQLAWCTPSTCTPQDLETVALAAVNLTSLKATATVDPAKCHTHVGKTLRGVDVFAICLLAVFIACAAASTVYDVLTEQQDQRRPLFLTFSIYSNWSKLIAVTNGANQLTCLNGIRTISMCWVIIAHVYGMLALMPTVNILLFAKDFIESFKRLVITNGSLSVDSFFVMSGLLLSFLFLKEVERTNRFDVVKFYVHRYVRLTPAVAILVLMSVTLLGYAGTGPLWDSQYDPLRRACEKNWWTNFLYINNYVHSDEMCLGHTWYLAVDMQLYWLSPLVLLPLWKLPKRIALLWVSFLMLIGWAISFTVVYLKELSPSFVAGGDLQRTDTMKYYYWTTHTRYVPWLMGVVLGYILQEARKKKPEFPKWTIALAWVMSTALMMTALNAAYPFQQMTWVYSRVEAAFWLSLFRAMWSLGLGWIIFACDQGHAGIVNKILSWNFFQPLARLSYGLYLMHIPILTLFSGVVQSPMYLADVTIIPYFFGVLLMTLAWTIPMVLLFESPIILIEKSIFAGNLWRQREQPGEYRTIENPSVGEGGSSQA